MTIKKADFIFVFAAATVVTGLALLPTPLESNPMIPANKMHKAVKNPTDCLSCHSAGGVYPLPKRHLTKRTDCANCHAKQ